MAKKAKRVVDAAKTTDGFQNFALRLGLRADNTMAQSVYTPELITRNRILLENAYRGSWIVGAAVDVIAEDMTRAGIDIHGSMDPKDIQQLNAAMTRLGLWQSIAECTKWARLYGGAIIFINVHGQDPSSPLNLDTIAKGQGIDFRVFNRWELVPTLVDIVEDGYDWGLPQYYDLIANIATGTPSNIRLHHTRVVRQVGIELPIWQKITEQFWGESVVERFWDRLIAFDAATQGASQLMSKAYLRTVGIDGLREILAAGGQAEENLAKMFHQMRYLQNNEGITLLDKNDNFEATSYGFMGIPDTILQFGQQISGALGIPLVRLFGQSPAGLSSTGESDLRNYYDNIIMLQESRLRRGLSLMLHALCRTLFGRVPEDFDFEFTPLWQTSAKERADIAAVTTAAVVQAYEAGIIDQATALEELRQSSDVTGLFSNITDEQIEAAKMPEPPGIEASFAPEAEPAEFAEPTEVPGGEETEQ